MSLSNLLIRVAVTIIIATGTARAQTAYTLHELDGPAADVNDSGTVVGWWNGPPVSSGPGTESRGYVWTRAAGIRPIITDPTTVNQFPLFNSLNSPTTRLRINSLGDLAGTACVEGYGCGVVPTQGAIWKADTGLTILESFPPINGLTHGSAAMGINSAREIVGLCGGGGYNTAGPCIWTEETGVQPSRLPGFEPDAFFTRGGTAYDVNEPGEVVGSCHGEGCFIPPGYFQAAFLWSRSGGFITLPRLPGSVHGDARAINDFGVVVGFSSFVAQDGRQTFRIFRWSAADGIEDLNAPDGVPEQLDINNKGDIVATIGRFSGGRVPYLYKDGVWTNLNHLLPDGTSVQLEFVMAINNRGWMVGSTVAGGKGFVLEAPEPEPEDPDDTTPPTLLPPADMSVNAIAPTGAFVTYAVAATDDRDPTPVVTCTELSATEFAIGTTRVVCFARDSAGNESTGSFLVTVKGAEAQLIELVELILTWDDVPRGAQSALHRHAYSALQILTTGGGGCAVNGQAAGGGACFSVCGELQGFAGAIRGWRHHLLTPERVARLQEDVRRIQMVLQCRP
jgi:hypothetical protein